MKQLILLTVAIVIAAPALADRREKIMERMDENKDGFISPAEFHPPRGNPGSKMIKRVDTDGDGAASFEELRTAREERKKEKQAQHEARAAKMDAMFTEMDTNGDGAVTEEEMRLHAFSRMDENNDGYLTIDELQKPRGHRGHHKRRHDSGV